jgi:hypothetical protein
MGHPVDVVVRSIERIDDPRMVCIGSIAVGLFGQNCVAWKRILDDLNDGRFGGQIRFADVVCYPLAMDLEGLSEVVKQSDRASMGRFDRNVRSGCFEP